MKLEMVAIFIVYNTVTWNSEMYCFWKAGYLEVVHFYMPDSQKKLVQMLNSKFPDQLLYAGWIAVMSFHFELNTSSI